MLLPCLGYQSAVDFKVEYFSGLFVPTQAGYWIIRGFDYFKKFYTHQSYAYCDGILRQ